MGVLKRANVRPEAVAIKLVGFPLYRLRAGKWRIIIEIDNKAGFIIVHKIGNRENISE